MYVSVYYYILAIRDGAFGACHLRGLPAAGSLRSPLPLALTFRPHTLNSTIKISKIAKIALFRFLALCDYRLRLNSPRYDEKLSCAAFSENGLEWPQFAPT